MVCESIHQLKADCPHPRNYPHMPTDYKHTLTNKRTDRRTDGWTDGRYQVHYLPASLSYAVNNYVLGKGVATAVQYGVRSCSCKSTQSAVMWEQ